MKKILGLVAIATLALVSCNKEEVSVTETGTKTVKVDVSGVFTKGQTAAVQAGNVQVNKLDVYFVDAAGTFHTAMNADGTAAISQSFIDAETLNGTTFHFLPLAVDHVIVIANADATYTNEAAVDAVKLDIADEQTTTALTLYAEAELTESGTDSEGHAPLYKASLTLEPRVSRIEISTFEYAAVDADTPRDYTSITVKQIFFNNYYLTASLASGAVEGEPIKETIAAGSVFNLMNGLASNTKYGTWSYDSTFNPAIGTLNAAAEWKNATTYTVPVAYNFFSAKVDPMPQLVVWLQAVDAKGDTANLYLATDGFTKKEENATAGAAITALDSQVYTVDFVFTDADLADPTKCVQLTVGVDQWVLVPVTPEF